MRKFSIIVTLVFVLAIAAEWFMLSTPPSGVVRGMKYNESTRSFTLHVETSYGSYGKITLPREVWRQWFDPKPNQ